MIKRLRFWFFAACISGSVAAEPTPGTSRAELLYSTHCGSCHTTQVHWRDKKLATSWATLKAQVYRWQDNTGLGWNDDDVTAVSRYLNDLYYRFPAPGSQATVEQRLRASAR